MAMKLLYRSTFIDVEECISDTSDLQSDVSEHSIDANDSYKKRSKSAPPNRTAEELSEMKVSMGALAQRAEQFHTRLRLKGKESKITSESSSSMEPANDMSSTASTGTDFGRQLSSISSSSGSVGHPELCRRPCMYFNLGKCVNGSNCEYCHFPHDQRTMHLDKRQRDVLSKIPHEQFLALILHYLEAKAEENGFKAAAKELLQLLRGFAHLGTDEPVALPQLPRKMWAKLDYMLSKMTFQSLVSLAMKSKTGSDFADSISDAMSRMRQSLQN